MANSIDEEMVQKLREGDPTAFQKMYETYSRFVYKRCLHLTRDPSTSEGLG